MGHKKTILRRKLPAGSRTIVVCLGLAVCLAFAEWYPLLLPDMAMWGFCALLGLQPLAVHALLEQGEAREGRSEGWLRAVLGVLGAPLLIAGAPLALVLLAPPSNTIALAGFAYQLLALRSVVRRYQPWVPAQPTDSVPRLADGAQRSALLARAEAAGVTPADVRIELRERVPEITIVGASRPIVLLTEGAMDSLAPPARESLLFVELLRRRFHRPLEKAIALLVPLGVFAALEIVHGFAWPLQALVCLVPFAYFSALLARVLDILWIQACRRSCDPTELTPALEASRQSMGQSMNVGAFLDLWVGDVVALFVSTRSRLSAAALLAQAVGVVVIPAIALWFPWQAPDGEPRPALVAAGLIALLPWPCSRLPRALGLRQPLDGVRMLVTAPPTWAAYLALLGTAATYCPSAPEIPLLPLCFLAAGMVTSWVLLPFVRALLPEEDDP